MMMPESALLAIDLAVGREVEFMPGVPIGTLQTARDFAIFAKAYVSDALGGQLARSEGGSPVRPINMSFLMDVMDDVVTLQSHDISIGPDGDLDRAVLVPQRSDEYLDAYGLFRRLVRPAFEPTLPEL